MKKSFCFYPSSMKRVEKVYFSVQFTQYFKSHKQVVWDKKIKASQSIPIIRKGYL